MQTLTENYKDTTIIRRKDVSLLCDVKIEKAAAILNDIKTTFKPKEVTYYHLKKYLFDC